MGEGSPERGALLGTFAGDALGRLWEGAAPLGERSGRSRVAESLRRGPLVYTDDTQLALALAEHLLVHPTVDPGALRATILEHHEPGRGYGAGMRQLVSLWREGVPTDEAATGVFPDGSFGNGAAMRVAPVGVRWRTDPERRSTAARRQARLTHVHPLGIAGARLQAAAVARAADRGAFGADDLEALVAREWPRPLAAELGRAVDAVERWDTDPGLTLAGVPVERGVVAHRSVPAALWCAAVGEGAEAAVALALGLGGDVDTIAAMAGAVAGAAAPASLPSGWVDAMEEGPRGRGHAEALADRLAGARV